MIKPRNSFDFLSLAIVAGLLLGGYQAAFGQRSDPSVARSLPNDPFILVLGTAQDAGFPQAGCLKSCCQPAWKHPDRQRFPTSLAIVDPQTDQRFLLDCSWQLPGQLNLLQQHAPREDSPGIDAIVLTHGHIGHYTGLMHLGREVIGADNIPVFAMPRMSRFLQTNGPWSLLVKLKNIRLHEMKAETTVALNHRIAVEPITVPHRGEFTETVGLIVSLPVAGTEEPSTRKVLFLPDIDKWDRWERRIEDVIQTVDIAFLDATFFQNGEIPGRDMSQIPHPFIEESILRFQGLAAEQRAKIHFIHLNHTNPALDHSSPAAETIRKAGMHLAEQGKRY